MVKTNTHNAGTGFAKLTTTARWALASLSLSMLMPSLDTSIANAGLPALAEGFNASFPAVQWVVLAYLLAITTLIVSAGRLGDMFGRRRLLLIGIGLFTIASVACGIAPTLAMLIAARAAQGLGAAIMLALTVALVSETVPKERTGSAMGLLGTMSALGTTLGPSLGGVLMAGFGWRAIFLVNLPLGLANYVLARRFLPSDQGAQKAKPRPGFDATGTVLLALTLAAYALSMTIGHGNFGVFNLGLLLAAGLIAAGFVLVERRTASPLIRLEMFRDPGLSAGLAMSALVSTVMMSTLVVGPFYLSHGLGLGLATVGLALSVGPLIAALAGVPAGRFVDRFGAQPMIAFGLAGIATGLATLALVPFGFGLAGYLAPIGLVTASYALFQAANNTAIMAGVDPEQRGVISGMLSLSRNLGLITGASVLGAVFAAAAGTAEIAAAAPNAIATGMRVTFAVAAFLVGVTVLLEMQSRIRKTQPALGKPATETVQTEVGVSSI